MNPDVVNTCSTRGGRRRIDFHRKSSPFQLTSSTHRSSPRRRSAVCIESSMGSSVCCSECMYDVCMFHIKIRSQERSLQSVNTSDLEAPLVYRLTNQTINHTIYTSLFAAESHSMIQQAVGGRPPRCTPPLSSLCGRRSASRRRADRNVAVVSHGQYVPMLTAAAA